MSFLSIISFVAWILGVWLLVSLALVVLLGFAGYRLKSRRQGSNVLTEPQVDAVRKDNILATRMPAKAGKRARQARMITLA